MKLQNVLDDNKIIKAIKCRHIAKNITYSSFIYWAYRASFSFQSIYFESYCNCNDSYVDTSNRNPMINRRDNPRSKVADPAIIIVISRIMLLPLHV